MTLNLKLPIQVPFMLIAFAMVFSETITINWLMYRSCDNYLQVNKSECLKLLYKHSDNSTDEIEKEVQPYVTTITMTKTVLTAIFSTILCLFLGSWSDIYGRKPVLLLGSGGFTFGAIILTIISAIPDISPWFILLCSIPTLFSGGLIVFLSANVCYITDKSTSENRGMKIAMFYLSYGGATVIALTSSSFALEKMGFLLIYILSSICMALSFLLTFFFVEESVLNCQKDGKFSNLFKISYVTDTVKVTFKKRENMDRTLILLIVSILTLYFLVFNVDSLTYLFLRAKLSWTLQQYTMYSSTKIIVAIFATGVLIYILNKLLKINESIIVTIGTVSMTISLLLFGLSSSNWQVYIAGIISCFGTATPLMLRTYVSKIVASDDYGKLFSFIAISESVLGPCGSPLFTFIYNKTLHVFPGTYFLVAAGITLLMTFMSITIVAIQLRYNQMTYYTLSSSQISA